MAKGRKKQAARRPRQELGDLGPPERAQHDQVRTEETMTAGVRCGRVMTQTMRDRYWRRGLITERQHVAAERLWSDWYASGRAPTIVASYTERMDRGDGADDGRLLASDRCRQAIQAVGIYLSPILVHVVCTDGAIEAWSVNRMKQVEAMALLRVALSTLADHYRMPAEDEHGNPVEQPRRIRGVMG